MRTGHRTHAAQGHHQCFYKLTTTSLADTNLLMRMLNSTASACLCLGCVGEDYLQLGELPSSEEDPSLAHLPPDDLDRLQHLAGDVSRLLIPQGLRVQVAVGALAASQQDVVPDGEGAEGLAGWETRACDADRLENTSRPQLLQHIVGGQAAGLGLRVGLDAPAF